MNRNVIYAIIHIIVIILPWFIIPIQECNTCDTIARGGSSLMITALSIYFILPNTKFNWLKGYIEIYYFLKGFFKFLFTLN